MNNLKKHIFVIFGASGDLTKRKIIPAIYNLFVLNELPEKFAVLGASRTKFTDNQFRNNMIEAIKEFGEMQNDEKLIEFANHLFYESIQTEKDSSLSNLTQKLNNIRGEFGIDGNTVFYLSTPPNLYSIMPKLLAAEGLNKENDGWKKLIIEKPFGYDLESAEILKNELEKDWNEDQIYRIDHYLGKETVQNLLVTRFSNGIFEPLWNRNYVHHVEITSAENIGVEKRGGYYDSSGALRDMVQNHLLQIAGLIAMEPPSSLDARSIRDEINKVFTVLRPIPENEVDKFVIRGQYSSSIIHGQMVPGYLEEEGIPNNSTTETFAAIKFYIDNWRWGGIPFYIRTGKMLPTKVTEAVIHFKPTPHYIFSKQDVCNSCNQLIIRIQPDEGILLKFGMKIPGPGLNVQNVDMDFHYSDLTAQRLQPAYERLIYDIMMGDKTLFALSSEVMSAWKFLDPILKSWKNNPGIPLYKYPAGSWGPDEADEIIEEEEMYWRNPCKNLNYSDNVCEL